MQDKDFDELNNLQNQRDDLDKERDTIKDKKTQELIKTIARLDKEHVERKKRTVRLIAENVELKKLETKLINKGVELDNVIKIKLDEIRILLSNK